MATQARTQRTHFGYEAVGEDVKQGKVNEVFSGVAWRYDLMNDLMSAGMHHSWKDHLIDKLRPRPGMHLLDVAGGTGDIAQRFLRAGGSEVTVCDINESMLTQGKRRMTDANLPGDKHWLLGNAEALPVEDRRFDAYTIAFGIRNVTRIDRALAEAYRVLKPGSPFFCLEFSHPQGNALKKIYDAYSFRIIPKIGKLVTGDEDAYRYLVESIRIFPDQEQFASMLRDAGFEHVSYTNLTGGIVALHTGWKL